MFNLTKKYEKTRDRAKEQIQQTYEIEKKIRDMIAYFTQNELTKKRQEAEEDLATLLEVRKESEDILQEAEDYLSKHA